MVSKGETRPGRVPREGKGKSRRCCRRGGLLAWARLSMSPRPRRPGAAVACRGRTRAAAGAGTRRRGLGHRRRIWRWWNSLTNASLDLQGRLEQGTNLVGALAGDKAHDLAYELELEMVKERSYAGESGLWTRPGARTTTARNRQCPSTYRMCRRRSRRRRRPLGRGGGRVMCSAGRALRWRIMRGTWAGPGLSPQMRA